MKKPTPEEYVIRYACRWGDTKKALKEIPPGEREKRESDHRHSERNLLQSVEILMKKKSG